MLSSPIRDDRLIGTIGLRQLSESVDTIAQAIAKPAVAAADEPALSLLPALTDGSTHAVIVIDANRRILGLISQTDLLSAVARLLPSNRTVVPQVA